MDLKDSVIGSVGGGGRVGQNAPRDQSEALAIDADGSVLRDAVKSMTSGSTGSTSHFNFNAEDDPEVEIDNESEVDNESQNGGGQMLL